MAVDISGADPTTLPTPFNPAFSNGGTITNASTAAAADGSPNALFAFAPDTPTTDLHAGDPNAALFYAVSGDIVGLTTGQTLSFNPILNQLPIFLAAKAVRIEAGQDIISLGNLPGSASTNLAAEVNVTSSGSLIQNANSTDVSVIQAGRDIIEANVQIAGPGNLIVQAGRNLDPAE